MKKVVVRNIKELNEVENEYFKILVEEEKKSMCVVAKFEDKSQIVSCWDLDKVKLDNLKFFGFDVELEQKKVLVVVYIRKTDVTLTTTLLKALYPSLTWEQANEVLIEEAKQYNDAVVKHIEI